MRLTLTLLCLLLPVVAQADLYKCLDNAGRITYTNASCDKAGLKEAKLILPPPPPAMDPPSARTTAIKMALAKPAPAPEVQPTNIPEKLQAAKSAPPREPAPLRPVAMSAPKLTINKAVVASSGHCAKINEQIGQIMDEMDAARNDSFTARQENDWDQRLARMQSEKTRMNCF